MNIFGNPRESEKGKEPVERCANLSQKSYTEVYPLATLMPMKDVGLRIRIDHKLREQFLEACKAEDKSAAQVIREFMRNYVEQRAVNTADVLAPGNDKTNRTIR